VATNVHLKVLLITASVMLLATSVDAGLRLETQSQLHTTVQVAASVAESGSVATLTLHMTAAKVTNDSSVRFEVGGIDSDGSQQTMLKSIASGDMDPDVNGDVDNTLEILLVPGSFDSISIMTATCPVSSGTSSPKTPTSAKASASGKAASDPAYFTGCTMHSQLTITNPVRSPTPTPTPTPTQTPTPAIGGGGQSAAAALRIVGSTDRRIGGAARAVAATPRNVRSKAG
jgi:hypothetical protein